MSNVAEVLVGIGVVALGAVLTLGFPDAELWWFEGRPLGVVLIVVGVLDLGWELAKARRRT